MLLLAPFGRSAAIMLMPVHEQKKPIKFWMPVNLLDPVILKESYVNSKHPAYPCILVLCYKYEFSFPH